MWSRSICPFNSSTYLYSWVFSLSSRFTLLPPRREFSPLSAVAAVFAAEFLLRQATKVDDFSSSVFASALAFSRVCSHSATTMQACGTSQTLLSSLCEQRPLVPQFSSNCLYLWVEQRSLGLKGRFYLRNQRNLRKCFRLSALFRNFAADLGPRAPSPAIGAGESARAPRQSSEITVVI